ncbi:MAG: DUF2971 domain-containing protein [Bacteroidales bacterium]|nr:DUF2971 domain-containing protein [Bacteroidales bacterium]
MVFAFSDTDPFVSPYSINDALKEGIEGAKERYLSQTIQVPKVAFNPENIAKRQKDLNDRIKYGCKVLCFSTDSSPFFGYEYSRMWALYGDNHKGVCIQINEQKFIEKNPAFVQGNLFRSINYFKLNLKRHHEHLHYDYTKEEKVGADKYLQKFRMKHKIPLFFTKYEEWKSEHEKRLIYFSKTNEENEYCTIEGCIDKVHLGIDFNDVYIPAIVQYTCHDKIFKIKFNDIRLHSIPVNKKFKDQIL